MRKPVANAGPDHNVDQGALVSFDGTGSSDLAGFIECRWNFTYDSNPVVLSGPQREFLFGIPGSYVVTLTVANILGNTETDTMTVTVNALNEPPIIITADVTDAVEGAAYSVDYDAIDIDGDVLTWAVATNATWLGINTTTGVLNGTPIIGIFYLNVSASDGNGGSDFTNFTLSVHSDSDGDGTPNYMDPDFLTVTEYNNQTVNQTVWNNATVWNNQTVNQTVPEYHNTTVWSNATVPEYHNTTVWANETVTVTNTETPMWAWGAVIAAIVLGVVAAITVLKGGKGPKTPAPEQELSEKPDTV
jgi:hypothetical protein